MSDIYDWLLKEAFFDELGNTFTDREGFLTVLGKLEVEVGRVPAWNGAAPADYWTQLGRLLKNGLVEGGLERLVAAAVDTFPGNETFKRCRDHVRPNEQLPDPTARDRRVSAFTIVLPEGLDDEKVLDILRAVRTIARHTGQEYHLDLVTRGSIEVRVSLEGMSLAELDALEQALREKMDRQDVNGQVRRESHQHRDAYLDPITVQGPDQQRFEAREIRASTLVKDVARAGLEQYQDTVWPQPNDGTKRSAVVNHVAADGTTRRLDPQLTLHEAGVRPGDTLSVLPESTAGVDPVLREEALVRARKQVQVFVASSRGVEVEANSAHAPTEYLLRFDCPSFAPPAAPGAQPSRIERHAVFLFLPAEFPVLAPQAYWQTPIFHPNIAPSNGQVCLGDIQDRYRPGLDFRELLQQLIDMAGWRNYTLSEGFNPEAASWAQTGAGQQAITEIGGRSLLSELALENHTVARVKLLRPIARVKRRPL